MENKKQYCGFVAIIGRPNVGKSTLMNHLIGQKISITSRKPQTTRHTVNGVLTEAAYQFIFVDTPGFQKQYLNKLNQVLNQSVINSLKATDLILLVVEAGIYNAGDQEVIDLLPQNANVILIINKQEKIKNKDELWNYKNILKDKYPFKNILMVSAKHHLNLPTVIKSLIPFMPLGDFLYPSEQLTDKSSKFLVAEIVREKLFRHLGQELPYNLTVEIDKFVLEDALYKISGLIIVNKDNQKAMVIGKAGEKLKKIATEARIDMEHLLEKQVFLQLWVKVRNGFADELKFLQQFE